MQRINLYRSDSWI